MIECKLLEQYDDHVKGESVFLSREVASELVSDGKAEVVEHPPAPPMKLEAPKPVLDPLPETTAPAEAKKKTRTK